MRIVTHKLYRAFPELDRFDDERCQNFVRSANRGLFRRLLRLALIGSLFWLVWIGVAYTCYLAYAASGFNPEVHRSAWVSMVGMGAPIVAGFVLAVMGGLVLRDVLLRRRIGGVIRMRGTCSECDYVLLGLTVGSDLKVTCPECGTITIADESMNELADGSNGQRVFSPADADAAAIFKPRKRWISKHTRRLLLRGSLAAVAVFVLGVCGLWLVVYLQTRSDIAAAKAELANVAEINAMLRARRPKFLPADATNLHDEWNSIADRLREITDQAESRSLAMLPPGEPRPLIYVDWSWLYRSPRADDPDNVEQLRSVARFALERIQAEQIEQRLCRTLVNGHGTVEFRTGGTLDEESQWTFPRLSNYRRFSRLLAFSLHDAHSQGDDERFRLVADAACAIVAHADADPGLISGLVATACEALVFGRFRAVLLERPPAERVAAIQSALDQFLTPPDLAWMIGSEAALVRRYLAFEFAEHHPNPVVNIWQDLRGAQDEHSAAYALLGETAPLWHQKGRFRKSISEADRILSLAADDHAVEPHARQAAVASAPRTSQRLVALLGWSTPRVIKTNDGRIAERRGLQIMLALESHRLDHGRYPDDLTQLAPEFMADVPIDPYSGKPFRYRLLDPQTDPHGRGYLLWSVGIDGTDDGGVAPMNNARHEAISGGTTRSGRPVDLVINEPGE